VPRVQLGKASSIRATLYSDPACPWAYSASPALRVLEWRYGGQLEWRIVLIGLTDNPAQYEERGYTPLRMAQGHAHFRRYGMPLAPSPRSRVAATGRACRAVVAARLLFPESEWAVFRALQLAWFTTSLLLDEDDSIGRALQDVPGVDADAIVSMLDRAEVTADYDRDRAEARNAVGSPAELQQKTAQTDGAIRFTAPSVVFERNGIRLVAGGFQPIQAYDVLVANLDPQLERIAAPEDAEPLLARFTGGLTSQEVAALLARGNNEPDKTQAEQALLELAARGLATRQPVGDDALWTVAARPCRANNEFAGLASSAR